MSLHLKYIVLIFCLLFFMDQPHPTVVDQTQVPLQCYTCNSEKTGEDCKNRTAIIENERHVSACSPVQKFCQVNSHSMPSATNDTAPKIWSMERLCAEECTPRCTTAPPSLPVQSCTFCCRENLCNGHDRPDLVVLASNVSVENVTKSSSGKLCKSSPFIFSLTVLHFCFANAFRFVT